MSRHSLLAPLLVQKSGYTPFMTAVEFGHGDIVDALLKKGAKPTAVNNVCMKQMRQHRVGAAQCSPLFSHALLLCSALYQLKHNAIEIADWYGNRTLVKQLQQYFTLDGKAKGGKPSPHAQLS